MKIGLVGHQGFLGGAFFKLIESHDDIVCFDKKDQFKVLQECEIIINANGNSSKFVAEVDPTKDFNANATFTLGLSLFAKEIDSLLVHISSGEATTFPKLSQKESNPIDSLTQLSNYGLSKAIGEILVKKYTTKSLIIRPAGLVGPGMKKGPIFDILNHKPLWIHPNSTLNIMRTETTARIVLELAKQHLQEDLIHEDFNLTGESTISLFEVSKVLSIDLIFDEDLPIYHSTIDINKNLRGISLPSSKKELMDFYLETLER